MLIRILLAVEPPAGRRIARLVGAQPDAWIGSVGKGEGIWEALAKESYDLVMLDRPHLPTAPAEMVTSLRQLPDRPEIIFFQEREDAQQQAQLLALGFMGVLPPELPEDILSETLRRQIARRRESLVNRLRAEAPGESYRLSDFASASPTMKALLGVARRVAAADSSLLILGETGVGKEWLARAIHGAGRRAASPFFTLNCAAVPDSLLESELFGHEKGAFTGAIRSRRGYFELAHRGTIFLDEIAEMSPHLQAKLLRVLQERKLQRVGSETILDVDVRVMAATNRDLEEAIRSRQLRSDLYYRLGVVTLTVPPLRERRDDIPPLVERYLGHFRMKLGRATQSIHPDALGALLAYDWPGNVRELINVMERTVLLCEGEEIRPGDLPENIVERFAGRHGNPGGPPRGPVLALPEDWLARPVGAVRKQVVESFEKLYLEEQLRRTGGRVGATARRVGINPRSLYDKMRRLGIRKDDFKVR